MIGKIVSRYRIVEKLGAGGMGEVYLAKDKELNRKIALKFLPPQFTEDPVINARFRHEAKAAAALSHANIVTVYDVGEFEGKTFIAMEYIHGQSLKDLLSKKELSLDRITNIMAQVCEGLSEAHRLGIVHRDIKPDNILIDARGRAKIVDFGLAKSRGDTKLTQEGSTVGTPAYMSPEQLLGDDIDHRTDIWSVGVVFYEMITGRTPFSGDFDAALNYSIMHEDPEPLARYKAGVSDEFQRIIDKALDKDTKTRYQHVDEVLADLKRLPKATTVGRSKTTEVNGSESIAKRFRAFVVPILILAIALAAGLGYFFMNPKQESGQRIQIAVADFVNLTDEKEMDALSGLLITALEQSRKLSVLTRTRMFDVLKQVGRQDVDRIDEKLGKQICHKANVNALLVASIQKFGSLYSVDFKMIDPIKDEYLFALKEEGEGQERIPSMIDNLAESVRKKMKEQEREIQFTSRPVAEVTTPNLEAYRYYFKGEELINKLKFEEAEQEFRQAIAIDSTFGLAYYRLAYTVGWLLSESDGHLERELLEKGLALIDRIPEKERYLVRAHKAHLEKGYSAGLAVLREMQSVYPNDKEMLFSIGDWSYHASQNDTAKLYLEKVLELDPTFARALQHLAFMYRDQGDYGKMLELAKENALVAGSPDSYVLLSRAYEMSGDSDTALEVLDDARQKSPQSLKIMREFAYIYFSLGQKEKARKALETILDAPQPDVLKNAELSDLGWSLTTAGKHLEAESVFRQGLELNPFDPAMHNGLGWSLFYQKKFAEGETVFRRCLALNPDYQVLFNGLGWSLFNQERYEEAEKAFRKGLELDASDLAILNGLGESLSRLGKREDAEEVYRKGLALYPNDVGWLNQLGWSLFNRERYEEAEKVFREGFAVHPTDKDMLRGLGWSLSNQGKDAEAELLFRKGLEVNPTDNNILNGLVRSLYNQEKCEEAEVVFRKALEVNPTNNLMLSGLGWNLLQQTKFSEAESVLLKGLQSDSSDIGILGGLGRLKMIARKYETAEKYYRKYAQVVPAGRGWGEQRLGEVALLKEDYAAAEQHLRKAIEIESTDAISYQLLGYLSMKKEDFAVARTSLEKALALDSNFVSYSLMSAVLVTGNLDFDKGITCAQKALKTKPGENVHSANALIYYGLPDYALPEHTLGLAFLKKGEYGKAVRFLEQAVGQLPERRKIQDDLQLAKQKLAEFASK